MTRVRADDYDDKKQLIIRRAAKLFASKGFESATMAEVAMLCKASKSHLYHYFPAKEDLLFEVVSEHTRRLTDIVEALVLLPLPADERFGRFVTSFIEQAADSRDEHLVLVNDLKYLPEAKGRQIRQMEGRIVDLVIDLLAEINPDAASLRARRPYALLLFGMLIWTFTWYHKTGEITPRELADRIAQLFLHGFRDHEFVASNKENADLLPT